MFTLDQALNAIKDKPEFKVHDREDYIVIDYMLQKDDTFKGEHKDILVNLRGTAFDKKTGDIISLPFHKFHNLNECFGYMENDIDLSQIESVMEKIDGSMIRPIPMKNGFRLGTRAGVTDVSVAAEAWMSADLNRYKKYSDFINSCTQMSLTPIFEYVGPKNKIVLDYTSENMILLAIRSIINGNYLPYESVKKNAELSDIPVVNIAKFGIGDVKHLENTEGVVVSLFDGFRFKVKSDWYVRRHRAKDLVRFSKDVVSMILQNEIDDVIPLLSKDEVNKIRKYQVHIADCIGWEADGCLHEHNKIIANTTSKKEYALAVLNSDIRSFSSIMFGLWDGKNVHDLIVKELLNGCTSSTKVEEVLRKYNITRFEDFE